VALVQGREVMRVHLRRPARVEATFLLTRVEVEVEQGTRWRVEPSDGGDRAAPALPSGRSRPWCCARIASASAAMCLSASPADFLSCLRV